MKRIKALCLAVFMAYALTAGAYAAELFPTQVPSRETAVCEISILAGEVLEFSARDLELRMELAEGTLGGATITALPQIEQGAVYLDGVEVELYQYLNRGELDELCFAPNETASAANLTLLPQGHDAVSTQLSIRILNEQNTGPTLESQSFNTLKNTPFTGYFAAADPEGDAMTIRITKPPEKGSLDISGLSFTYRPYHNLTGSDSFSVCASDRFSNYSAEAVIEIKIESNRSGFVYLDMQDNPSHYAAVKLHENKVLSGEQVGASWFFRPGEQVSRGDFLVMVLAAAGMEDGLAPTVNTQLPEDSKLPIWLKPYAKKALDEGVLQQDTAFAWEEIPTRAEAVVMIDRAARITDVKDFDLQMPDSAEIPGWALASYRDLAAYRMLDLYDGMARPSAALTRSYAADLVWQLWKHCNR